MKKPALFLVIGLISFGVAGCFDPCKEDALDKLGDTIATIGKSGAQKDQALAQRKADRAAKCTEKKAGAMKKKMGF